MYKAVVYQGGSNNGDFNPGTLVFSQDISLSSLNMNSWNTITLNTPIVVNATQELWFGIYMEAPGGTYCIPLSSNSKPKKGCICGTHSPGSVSWEELFPNMTFCIRGTMAKVQTVMDYQVSRNGIPIGTTTATSIEDHVTHTDTYTYSVTANWSNGCTASEQKSFTNIANISATPDALDFYANFGHGTLVKTVIVNGNGISGTIQATVNGNFCPQCGAKKPEPKPADGWKCPKCGADVSGNFCPECGTKKPEPKPDGWTCPECGAVNKGKFCSECGAKKPAGAKLYKCDKCGWEPEDPEHPPKFCPECGDPFDDSDVQA